MDEPTAGLHPKDTRRLIETLLELRDQGNSVLVVEHDLECMRQADWLVDLGPGAGRAGGNVIASGPPAEVGKNTDSITAKYLRDYPKSGDLVPSPLGGTNLRSVPGGRRPDEGDKLEKTSILHRPGTARRVVHPNPLPPGERGQSQPPPHPPGERGVTRQASSDTQPQAFLTLTGARRHNLKNVTLQIPLGRFTCVTGVSGSGKSSLISQTLVPAVRQMLNEGKASSPDFDELKGTEPLSAILEIDQSPLGRQAMSTPATYSGMWDEVRKLYAKTKESRVRGFKSHRFSFNSREGRCPECKGRGTMRVEMHFLPDVEIECPMCRGARFNRQTLSAKFRGQSVADVLSMQVSEAREFFQNFHRLHAMLSTFEEVGLGYLRLGQSARTLSGGEAQRVKLASALCQPDLKPTLFVLDEPTLGLHPQDVERLLELLRRLVDSGQMVVVVEHHEDVMLASDWIIDLGPEGGAQGGEILKAGTPTEIADEASPTGEALRRRLGQ